MERSLSLLLLIGCALHVVGCADSATNDLPGQALAATAAATSATAPQGPFPRGSVSTPPVARTTQLEVLSPERGALLTATSTEVTVSASDPAGIVEVLIGGQVAAPTGGDTYATTVQLEPGVNFIPLEARARDGGCAKGCVSVTQGQFLQEGERLPRSLAAGLGNDGLAKVMPALSALAQALSLEPYVLGVNPVYTTTSLRADVVAFRHAAPRFDLEGVPGGARLALRLEALELDVAITDAAAAGAVSQLQLLADRLSASVELSLTPLPATGPPPPLASRVQIGTLQVVLEGTSLTANSQTSALLGRLLQGALERMLEDVLHAQLPTFLQSALAQGLPGIDRGWEFSLPIPGSAPAELSLSVLPHDLDGTSAGLAASLGLQVAPRVRARASAPDRFLHQGTQVQLSTGAFTDDFTVGVTADAMNAFLHALWVAGGTSLIIDGATINQTATVPLAVRLLYPFFPTVREVAPDPATPLRVEVLLDSAPVVRLGRGAQPIEVAVGEARVRFLIDYCDGGAPLELCTLALPLQLTGDVAVSADAIRVANPQLPHLYASLVDEPTVDIDDEALESLLNLVVPDVLAQLGDKLPSFPMPQLPLGLELSDAQVEVAQDVLVVRGSLR